MYSNILTSIENGTSIIRLNRPKALNALCVDLMVELQDALQHSESNKDVRSIVITGNEKAFAAGADIKEMADKTYAEVTSQRWLESWDYVTKVRKPVIAAVDGYALGGGFELALMCAIIIAGKNAPFGLPAVKLGTIPGAGGTQRLIREIGKSRAMEMVLTGKFMKAEEALKLGLVSRIAETNALEESIKVCNDINKFSLMATTKAKECVNKAYELGLENGLNYEKQMFWGTFATEDRKEGMQAFVEKRNANFKDQ